MRHFLAVSSLAVLLVAGSQQSASAWCSFQFGIGMNIGFSCGKTPCCPQFDMYGPGYGGMGGPVHAGYMNPGYGHAQMPAQMPGQMPASNFVAPAPTPLGAHSMAPTDYVYPAAYPASYQPMSYPAGYYPMSYYGYYGQ